MSQLKWLLISIFIFIAVTGLLFLDKSITKKISSAGKSSWRLLYGIAHIFIAFLVFSWIQIHSPYAQAPGSLMTSGTLDWVFDRKTYIFCLVGVGLLALSGIGEIIVWILNKRSRKQINK